jgi:uncharacterized membrane protein YphA (DoxX/SURF4 family)
MKILRLFCSVITGLVFMFSGTVKAIDPLGSAYKFQDYFGAFHLNFLQPLALPLAILLCTAEFMAGFSVLTGYRQKAGIWGVMIFMLIFTPLTLILAITNPVSDCGCFGDAIHLTNWQTFGKNIVLLVLVLILFTGRKRVQSLYNQAKEWVHLTVVMVLFVGFSLLNLRYLPLLDFLPYKAGNNIPENMRIPEGKPFDEYSTSFIYEKDGEEKEFTLENYPADDSTWKFVDQKSVLVKKGYQPPIHDFSITTREGADITEQILNEEGYTLLMISKKLEDARRVHLEKGFELGVHCLTEGAGFYVVTASGSDMLGEYGNGLALCTADETTLKTILRANPGYLLLKGGTITGKWSWADVPSHDQFTLYFSDPQAGLFNNKSPVLLVYTGGISVLALILLINSFIRRNKGSV